ncbi:hypothetical protein A4G13_02520 [Basfia succiniciproducens]|nr:hypothetical protein A4G13_02520 [Basfia succiniciproducens]
MIQRVRYASDYATQLKSSTLDDSGQMEPSSLLDILTALFKRLPSGLQFTLEAGGRAGSGVR